MAAHQPHKTLHFTPFISLFEIVLTQYKKVHNIHKLAEKKIAETSMNAKKKK